MTLLQTRRSMSQAIGSSSDAKQALRASLNLTRSIVASIPRALPPPPLSPSVAMPSSRLTTPSPIPRPCLLQSNKLRCQSHFKMFSMAAPLLLSPYLPLSCNHSQSNGPIFPPLLLSQTPPEISSNGPPKALFSPKQFTQSVLLFFFSLFFRRSRSGNPGYLIGKPVLYGTESNNQIAMVESGLAVLKPPLQSLAKCPTLESIENFEKEVLSFGYDQLASCVLSLNRSELKSFCCEGASLCDVTTNSVYSQATGVPIFLSQISG
jgi:hypothetical protein